MGEKPAAVGGQCAKFALLLSLKRAGNAHDGSGEATKSYPAGNKLCSAAGGKSRPGKSIYANRPIVIYIFMDVPRAVENILCTGDDIFGHPIDADVLDDRQS